MKRARASVDPGLPRAVQRVRHAYLSSGERRFGVRHRSIEMSIDDVQCRARRTAAYEGIRERRNVITA